MQAFVLGKKISVFTASYIYYFKQKRLRMYSVMTSIHHFIPTHRKKDINEQAGITLAFIKLKGFSVSLLLNTANSFPQ
jgi:hypothetical protein